VNVGNTTDGYIVGPGWRMLMVVYRLSSLIEQEYGTPAKVFHKGFKGAGGEENRHNRGLALDFAGAETPKGKWDVLDDWGKETVLNSMGGVNGKWPASTTTTRYRLNINNPYDTACDFFVAIYNFAIEQCRDGSTTKQSMGAAGAPWEPASTGFVIHPDHGTPGRPDGRDAHQDHIHMDVGG